MGEFRTALICLNGHCISDEVDRYIPEATVFAKHCTLCGAPNIMQCTSCNANIRGYFFTTIQNRDKKPTYKVPAYCHECGSPYPWTLSALQAAEEIIKEEELQPEEQTALVSVLPNLICDTSRTPLAVLRLKKFMVKAGPAVASTLKDLLISFTVEAAKKGFGW